MRRITIALPDGLYMELCEVAADAGEVGYGPAHWASDVIASELAARRLPKIAPARYGARVAEPERETELEPHFLRLPERV
jgi:hypothetical protein